ncbi:hypothetical protein ACFS5M_04835 [Lacinutrix iliipiscaria]|uniref:Lipoprotein n=1 Tax=Lacinutrix iliipiscaria TaxID=1230532 RepID=A0ABW5WMA9_9FLAO
MKTFNLTTKVVLVLVVLGLTFTGCTSDASDDPEIQEQDYSEVVMASEMDRVSASLEDFLIEVYEDQEDSETRVGYSRTAFPGCTTITVVAELGYRQLTVDFGEGCVIRGHLYQGKIIITYDRDIDEQQVSIGYVLEDFYFDAKQVIGSNSILRELSNDDGNPQFTHTLDLTVVWPSGVQASREGLKVREWVEGFGSGVFSDNVFEVTGYWVANFVSGHTHSYEIDIPLRREVVCYYFVSGSVNVERTAFGGVFDYGEGDCDNQATFTFNSGDVVNITLN